MKNGSPLFFGIILSLVLGSISCELSAHPPKDLSLEYDVASRILKVAVLHQVRDASKHYIDDVEVFLGKKKMISQKFGRQKDLNGQEALYFIIDALPGTEIAVAADCNLGGTLKKSLVVSEDEKENRPAVQTP